MACKELRLKLAELGDEDEARAASIARTLDDLEAFAGYALPLIEVLDQLPASAHWGEWLDRLGALATRALRQPDRVLSILAELAPMAPVGPVTLDEVLRVLSDSSAGSRSSSCRPTVRQCLRGTDRDGAGPEFRCGFRPRAGREDVPAEDRRGANSARCAARATRRRARSSTKTGSRASGLRLRSLRVLQTTAYFSYPRLDLDPGRARVPSFYALEAVRAAEGRLPDFAELARRAETATSTRLGWPAPSDPADAIDDAEYDLAILDRLFSAPGESAGAARYLLTANPYLARALSARYQRWSRDWTSADGLVCRRELVRTSWRGTRSPPGAIRRPLFNITRAVPIGSSFRRFTACAARGARAIDELDPLQRGSLVHDIQFALFARLRDEGLLPVRPRYLER